MVERGINMYIHKVSGDHTGGTVEKLKLLHKA